MGKQKNTKIVVIGCGRLGSAIAGTLSEKGAMVTVVDKSADSFRRLPQSFGGMTQAANATDMHIANALPIDADTTVFCLTSNENLNIMIAQMVRYLFVGARVVARLQDSGKVCLFEGQGIEVVCPSEIMQREIYTNYVNMPMGEVQDGEW
ncbi:MAG: NAD-binding protein [Firmicutes bacterium]|nr:NAD-binding protein [Bacillota bacterium]